MRAEGWGWGAIRIATSLAQQMVANSVNAELRTGSGSLRAEGLGL